MLNNDIFVKSFYRTDILKLHYWCFFKQKKLKKKKKIEKPMLCHEAQIKIKCKIPYNYYTRN